MYKTPDKSQPSFPDFNQPFGLQMNPDNHWVQLADRVPWDIFEENIPPCFPARQGTWPPASWARFPNHPEPVPVFGSGTCVTTTPYFQYFIGLPGYQAWAPFDASALVCFRKRITMDILNEANEYMLEHNDDGPVPL